MKDWTTRRTPVLDSRYRKGYRYLFRTTATGLVTPTEMARAGLENEEPEDRDEQAAAHFLARYLEEREPDRARPYRLTPEEANDLMDEPDVFSYFARAKYKVLKRGMSPDELEDLEERRWRIQEQLEHGARSRPAHRDPTPEEKAEEVEFFGRSVALLADLILKDEGKRVDYGRMREDCRNLAEAERERLLLLRKARESPDGLTESEQDRLDWTCKVVAMFLVTLDRPENYIVDIES